MRNIYNKEALLETYSKYKSLINNKDYRKDYELFRQVNNGIRAFGVNLDIMPADHLEIAWNVFLLWLGSHFRCWRMIKRKWGILEPVNPTLKLRKKDFLARSIRKNSAADKVIRAFDTQKDIFVEIIEENKKQQQGKLVKKKEKKEERYIKYLAYFLKNKLKYCSNRKIATFFKVNKETISNWIDEVEKWTEKERNQMVEEFIGGRKTDIDVLQRHHSTMCEYDDNKKYE